MSQRSPFVSVILCTHNPRRDVLESTVASLKAQDLSPEQWELIVVDNLSHPPVSTWLDLSWHPNHRVVIESELGLARARRRGYLESRGELIVHSDDDNVLSANYLSSAAELYVDHPQIGAFG